MDCLLVAGALLLAYLVRGATGFGSGLVGVPLLALMLPLTLVVPVVSALDYLASITHGVAHRAAIVWRDLWVLLLPALLGLVLALYLFKNLDLSLLTRGLGVFVLLYAAWALLAVQPKQRRSRAWGLPLGLLAGLIGTLFGIGGPFYVIYFRLRRLDKHQFRASFAMTYLIEGLARLVGYALAGLFDRDGFLLMLAGIPVVFAGLYLGEHIHSRLSQRGMHRLVSVLVLLAGVALLMK
jgi:hypothetical protein